MMDDETILSDDRYLRDLLNFIPREQLRTVTDEEKEMNGRQRAMGQPNKKRKGAAEDEAEEEEEDDVNGEHKRRKLNKFATSVNQKKDKFKLSKTNDVVIAQMFPHASAAAPSSSLSASHNVAEMKSRMMNKINGGGEGNRKRSSSSSSSSIASAVGGGGDERPSAPSSTKRHHHLSNNAIERMQFAVKDSNGLVTPATTVTSVDATVVTTGRPLTTKSISNIKKLLREAEVKKARLEHMKKDASKTEEVEKATLDRLQNKAAGEKLRDDPRLLKKTLKRLEHRKRKSASEWKERKRAEEKSKKDRSTEREANIRERSMGSSSTTGATTKKTSSDATPRRAGFEGRINGALNSNKKKQQQYGNKKQHHQSSSPSSKTNKI